MMNPEIISDLKFIHAIPLLNMLICMPDGFSKNLQQRRCIHKPPMSSDKKKIVSQQTANKLQKHHLNQPASLSQGPIPPLLINLPRTPPITVRNQTADHLNASLNHTDKKPLIHCLHLPLTLSVHN